jgi:hypothetical protein
VLPVKTGASFQTPKSSKNLFAPASSVANVLTLHRGVKRWGENTGTLTVGSIGSVSSHVCGERRIVYELQEELNLCKSWIHGPRES